MANNTTMSFLMARVHSGAKIIDVNLDSMIVRVEGPYEPFWPHKVEYTMFFMNENFAIQCDKNGTSLNRVRFLEDGRSVLY